MHDFESNPSESEGEPKLIGGRYEIVSKLGQGGMGVVYKAVDRELKREVAVKVLSLQSLSDEHFRRFQQEARAASKLNYPGIVTALDFGVTEKREPFLVMQYVQGETLDVYIREHGVLALDDFVSLFSQVTNAMSHAHSRSVIHRDLKPSNLVIQEHDDQLRAFILDFGIAKILNDTTTISNTKTGQIVGSPQCMSPEQIYGHDVDVRSDVYSIGCVMFEALTGKPPFKGASAMETIQMHLNEAAPKLSERSSEMRSEQLEKLIAKTLAKDPNDRYQTMGELSTVLSQCTETNEVDAPADDLIPRPSRQSGSLLYIATASIVILIVAFAFVFRRVFVGQDEPSNDVSKVVKDTERPVISFGLEKLDLNYSDRSIREQDSLTALRSGPPDSKVEDISLDGNSVTDSDLEKLSKFRNLKYLSVTSADMTEKRLQIIIKNAPQIQHLNIKNVRTKNLANLIYSLRTMKKLWLLRVDFTNAQDEDLKTLSELKSLATLWVGGNPKITDAGMVHIAKIHKLASLNLSSTGLTPEGLRYFKGRKHLSIIVSGCPAFTGYTMERLNKLAAKNGIGELQMHPFFASD